LVGTVYTIAIIDIINNIRMGNGKMNKSEYYKKWSETPAGKVSRKKAVVKYSQTPKGKAARKKYQQSEKYKAARRRYRERKKQGKQDGQ
jgi:hypothetical protein